MAYGTDLSDPRPGARSRGKSTRDVVRLSRRSAGAGNMPEGPLKSRTVMMRDECSGRSLAASGRLIQCSNNVLQFPVQNSKTSHTSQKLSAKRKELPRGHLPSLDTPASKKGWARSAGMQNVGEHCSGNGAGLIGTLGRIGGSLNLDCAGGTSSQVPGTIGLPEFRRCSELVGLCGVGGGMPSERQGLRQLGGTT